MGMVQRLNEVSDYLRSPGVHVWVVWVALCSSVSMLFVHIFYVWDILDCLPICHETGHPPCGASPLAVSPALRFPNRNVRSRALKAQADRHGHVGVVSRGERSEH